MFICLAVVRRFFVFLNKAHGKIKTSAKLLYAVITNLRQSREITLVFSFVLIIKRSVLSLYAGPRWGGRGQGLADQ